MLCLEIHEFCLLTPVRHNDYTLKKRYRGGFMSSKEKILKILGKHSAELSSRFSVKRIGLFGSYARNDALPESDIDLLVEFTRPTFDNYMDLKFYLEEMLETSVDLVMLDSLKPRLIPYVTSEVIYAQGHQAVS